MRTIFAFLMTSLDGYHEGAGGDIDWHTVDEQFNEFAIRQLDGIDLLVFGRVTYELMASYWPTEAALHDDPEVAGRMNAIRKLVATRTLDRADWANTDLERGDVAARLRELKAQPGGDIAIFGSSHLVAGLLREGLVDELRIMVSPVLLGSGHPLFETADRTRLELIATRLFRNGNVLLTYRLSGPAPGSQTPEVPS
jgi:dihydrofolate reductase